LNLSTDQEEDMDHDEKLCPFCAEPIKVAAIRCKHCQADLTQSGDRAAAQALLAAKKKGSAGKILLWIILLPVLALAGLMVIGALSGPPSAKDQARSTINLCWKDFDDPLKSANTKQFVRDACHSMIARFEAQYGPSSTIRRD
jgi:hypothetical protein